MLDAIYLRILDMSVTASLVILAVLLVRFFLRKAPKVFSYALWAVVLFRLLCPVSLEAPVSVIPEVPLISQEYELVGEPISLYGAGEAAYRAVGDALNGGLGVQRVRTTEKTEDGMTRYVNTDWWDVWILFGKYVWIMGIAVMLLHNAGSYWKLRQALAEAVPLRGNIYLTDDNQSPFVMGLFRPKIYLPGNLTEREREYIILHEEYHIKRLDHIVKLLAFLALTIHWYNPLVWLAFCLLSRDMEMSCDEAVLRRLGSNVRADYAASLLALATGRRIISGTPLAFGEGDTKGRIRNLSRWKKPALWVTVLATIACAVLALCLLTDSQPREPGGSLDISAVPTKEVWRGELIPGTTYVPYQCLYMNPLSSYSAAGGDSGFKYEVGEDYFAVISRYDSRLYSSEFPNLDTADNVQNRIDVPNWEWLPFPYTDEEWAALYFPGGFGGITNISELYDEILYQPLTDEDFLLQVDEALWLVDLSWGPQTGAYLWSIYSLVPESVMGMAQWEYAPMLSSRSPVFRFEFSMEHREISAVCTESLLMDYDAPGHLTDSGSSMVYPEDRALYWSPIDENNQVVTSAVIHFTVHPEDGTPYHGTIYIDGNSAFDGRRIYTATLVGTGLRLEPNSETEGGMIRVVDTANQTISIVEHDLSSGDLEIPAEALAGYVFYTNSEQIAVSVKYEDTFAGTIRLLDISQGNAEILTADVSSQDDDCLFTGLTSARRYRIVCEGLAGSTLVIYG